MTGKAEPVKAPRVPMVQRNVRVPLTLWDRAAALGAAETPPRGVSDVVRDLLSSYVGLS